ncbi:nedd8-conjugating enzyme ubc12 [Anaeramoeba ignava]|uniref:NEDD8 carrier protein n=1 Tax=Anaeramoeba ignava TaxID=1746090 RepID=A0A9Q0REB1_ANAIG|nr:nedd8-conjugating enzyme ubc12 [Anaeramoeba ignava]
MQKLIELKKERKQEPTKEEKQSQTREDRIQKDLQAIEKIEEVRIEFPEKEDFSHFKVIITPLEGFYKNGSFVFDFKIPQNYPVSPPKVFCETKIFHPNIDENGYPCLNILDREWNPILDLNSIIFGLIFMFLEPNPDDPDNRIAGELLRKDKDLFQKKVQEFIDENSKK